MLKNFNTVLDIYYYVDIIHCNCTYIVREKLTIKLKTVPQKVRSLINQKKKYYRQKTKMYTNTIITIKTQAYFS